MQPLAARCLAKTYKPKMVQPISDLARPGNYLIEGYIWSRIQVEDQPPRSFGLESFIISRVQFQRHHLSYSQQRLHAIELQIGLPLA